MKRHNQYLKKEQIAPVSRKTNEEIDQDEAGELIIGGKYTEVARSAAVHEISQKDDRGLADQED